MSNDDSKASKRPPCGAQAVNSRAQRVAELTAAGWKAADIAEELGITTRTVQRLRVRTGVAKHRWRPMTDAEIQHAAMLLDDGASLGEVCRTLGRDQTTLRKYFPGRGWNKGDGIESRRMMAALDAIPGNICSLTRGYRDPGAVSITCLPLHRLFTAMNAIPESDYRGDEGVA